MKRCYIWLVAYSFFCLETSSIALRPPPRSPSLAPKVYNSYKLLLVGRVLEWGYRDINYHMTFTSRRLVLLWWYKYKCWRHTRLKEWCWIFSGHHAWRILFHCGMANIGSVTFTVNTDSSFILRLPPTSCWLQYQHCKWWKLGGSQGQRLHCFLKNNNSDIQKQHP